MLIGATLLCMLVLLVLVADRLGSRMWHGVGQRDYYRCAECDLRYPRREIRDPAFRFCPSGHLVILEPRSTTAGTVGICACLGFLVVSLLLMVSGVVPQ